MPIKQYQGTPQRPGRKGYVTTTFTGDDVKKARGMLDKQAKESAAKIAEEKAGWKNPIRNHRGQLRMVSDKSLQQIQVMQKANAQLYPKGSPSVRSATVVMSGAYFKNGRLVREGDPDY